MSAGAPESVAPRPWVTYDLREEREVDVRVGGLEIVLRGQSPS
jgi:hypothetical protein